MTGQRRWQGYVGSGLVSALGLLGVIGIYVSMRHVASLSANLSELQRLLQVTRTSLVQAAAPVAKPDTAWQPAGGTPPPAPGCADADRLSRDLQTQLDAFRSSLRDEFSAWAEALMPRAGEGDAYKGRFFHKYKFFNDLRLSKKYPGKVQLYNLSLNGINHL